MNSSSIRSPIKQLRDNPINFDDSGESQVAEIVAAHKQNTTFSSTMSPRASGLTSPRKQKLSNSLQLNKKYTSSDSYSLSNSNIMSSQFLDSDDDDGPMTLGCIWSIVLNQAANGNPISSPRKRKHIHKSDDSKKSDELLSWAVQRLRSLGYNNVDTGEGGRQRFNPPELALLALIHSYRPDLIDYDLLDPKDHKRNALKLVNLLNDLGVNCFVFNKNNSNDEINLHIKRRDLLAQIAALKLQFDDSTNQTAIEEDEFDLDEVQARDIDIHFDDENMENEQDDLENEQHGTESEQHGLEDETKMFNGKIGEGDNLQFASREFAITIDVNDETGQQKRMALVMIPEKPYVNPAGRMIAIAEPYTEHDENQRFVFGKAPFWTTVIDSKAQKGMVWDVADELNLDPPEGTPFYLFPFHGRHNQHFIYRIEDNRIIATQNGQAVTYVGGEKPFVMRLVSEDLKPQQTFHIEFFSE